MDLVLGNCLPAQIRWALYSGLGPLLRRVTAGDPQARKSPLWPLIESADLTARVMASERLDAAHEIIRACEGRTEPLTLLKGISICEQFYPEPQLRPMSDIDLLVGTAAAAASVETQVLELGYRHASPYPPDFYETHHHLRPLVHSRTRVCVEIHQGLFPPSSRIATERAFSRANLAAELRPSSFRNCRVNRLSEELQVVYIASHWAFALSRVGGIVGMLDLVYLLAKARPLRWERILEWLDGSLATTYVYVLLSYLSRHRLIRLPPEVLQELFARQRSFGRANLRVLHTLLDRYVTEGHEFGMLVSARNFDVLWTNLARPSTPTHNVLRAAWNLRPSRAWFKRRLGEITHSPSTKS